MNDEIRASGDENAVLIAVNGIMFNTFIEFREWLYGNAKFPCELSNIPGIFILNIDSVRILVSHMINFL